MKKILKENRKCGHCCYGDDKATYCKVGCMQDPGLSSCGCFANKELIEEDSKISRLKSILRRSKRLLSDVESFVKDYGLFIFDMNDRDLLDSDSFPSWLEAYIDRMERALDGKNPDAPGWRQEERNQRW